MRVSPQVVCLGMNEGVVPSTRLGMPRHARGRRSRVVPMVNCLLLVTTRQVVRLGMNEGMAAIQREIAEHGTDEDTSPNSYPSSIALTLTLTSNPNPNPNPNQVPMRIRSACTMC